MTNLLRLPPTTTMTAQQAGRDDTKDAEDEFNRGIEACMSRLYEMHRIATERHNLYHHAALELAKLKEKP